MLLKFSISLTGRLEKGYELTPLSWYLSGSWLLAWKKKTTLSFQIIKSSLHLKMKAIYEKAFEKHVSLSFKHKSERQVIIPTGDKAGRHLCNCSCYYRDLATRPPLKLSWFDYKWQSSRISFSIILIAVIFQNNYKILSLSQVLIHFRFYRYKFFKVQGILKRKIFLTIHVIFKFLL